jgi:hypothetical protein
MKQNLILTFVQLNPGQGRWPITRVLNPQRRQSP